EGVGGQGPDEESKRRHHRGEKDAQPEGVAPYLALPQSAVPAHGEAARREGEEVGGVEGGQDHHRERRQEKHVDRDAQSVNGGAAGEAPAHQATLPLTALRRRGARAITTRVKARSTKDRAAPRGKSSWLRVT